MNTIKSIRTNDNNASCSRAKNFIGVPVIDADGKLLNGEFKYKFNDEEEETVCRFVDGFLDGNVYDKDGNVVETLPALEYSFGGKEYWTKGSCNGRPQSEAYPHRLKQKNQPVYRKSPSLFYIGEAYKEICPAVKKNKTRKDNDKECFRIHIFQDASEKVYSVLFSFLPHL